MFLLIYKIVAPGHSCLCLSPVVPAGVSLSRMVRAGSLGP